MRELNARTYGSPYDSVERPQGVTEMFFSGGVMNANYLSPKARYYLPMGDSSLVVGLLIAWVDTHSESGTAGIFFADRTDSSDLGTELDRAPVGGPRSSGRLYRRESCVSHSRRALEAMFHEHVGLSVESGSLWYGDALRSALPDARSSFPLQSRLAFVW